MAVLQEFKCPCCDGSIGFDSSSQKMKCPYCDTEFEVESIKSYLETTGAPAQDDMTWEASGGGSWQTDELTGLRTYVCESCSGEIVGDENTAATTCPFCDSPVVMQSQFANALRPDLVIPFKLDKKAAKEALKKHYAGKKLLPKVFKDENHIDQLQGIYVPFWFFDADAQGNMTYKATRIRTWSDSEYYYTKTMHYHVVRAGSLGFQNVPVDGSSKMDDTLMEALEPFDMQGAVDFNTAYLAGFLADKYDVASDRCATRANQRIKATTEAAFRNTVSGYSSVLPVNSAVQLKNSRSKYVLCPVWVLNTTWEGKKYTFAMNGQTGKLVGDLPADKKALWRWFFSVFGIVTAASFLFLWLASLL